MSIAFENILFELICFIAFFTICVGLSKFRCTKRRSALILAASVAVGLVIQLVILLTASNAVGLALTLLPLTVYLPVIVAVHVLAKGGFASAVAAWSMGLLAPYILNLFRELIREIWVHQLLSADYMRPVLLGSLILGTLLAFAALRFCRKPFQTFEFQDRYVWLIVPVVLFFLLISYFESLTFDPFLAFLVFVIVLITFVFLIKFLHIAMSEQNARASEQEVAKQLNIQKQELLRISQKVEQGQIYRHDMRHHLLVLRDLVKSGKTEDMQEYIDSLDARITNLEEEQYCNNAPVNAVLSTYVGKAKQKGIQIEVKADIPKELPVDPFDVCTILANALDNAVAACCGNQRERWIYISVSLHENENISVSIRNPCETPVKFGEDGLPVSQNGEGHGFGLKSIDVVVKKYNGLLRCTFNNGVFQLNTVLFPPDSVSPAAKPSAVAKNAASHVAVSLLLAVCLLNFLPNTMQTAAALPAVGNVIRMLDVHSYHAYFSWGSSDLQVNAPQVSSDPVLPSPSGVDDMNQKMEDYIKAVEDEFLYQFSRRYNGYVASDTGYNILRDDEHLLSVQFYTTVNMGGSFEYTRCFTLDKTSGTILTLADLFAEGSDYVSAISADILRQMEEQVAAGEADYFIPGGIFSDEECFQAIDPDQDFYLDENNRLIIVFEEYEVAPGSAGAPKFAVEPEVLQEILRQPSMLSQAEQEAE